MELMELILELMYLVAGFCQKKINNICLSTRLERKKTFPFGANMRDHLCVNAFLNDKTGHQTVV